MGNIFDIAIIRPFGLILMAIYNVVHSYGLAIILFALLAKVLMLPLSYKSKKSMLKMTGIQGQMKDLQKKYAGNNVKLNEEMQKLYEREGVSPMSGCLPMLITLPIMMALYYVVQQPLKFMIGLGETDITALGNLVGISADAAAKTATYQLDIAQGLNQFLTSTGHFSDNVLGVLTEIGAARLQPIDFSFLGLDLSLTPTFPNISILWIIPLLSGLTAFLSSYIMQKMQGTQVQGSMKMMNIMMPLMSVYFGFIFPASIGIYWVTNNVLTMLQEIVLTAIIKKRHPIKSDIQLREEEQAERRRLHEEKMRRLAEEGATPNPNTSRKKREKKK